MFLTPEQLEQLTGKVRPSAQARWLTEHNWKFILRGDGRPVVHEAEAERQMCGGASRQARRPTPTEPKLEALS
jgi:hypothetical protein